MIVLVLGVLLWSGAHLLKRLAPDARQQMQERMGDASKGVFAALLLLSVVLMVIGYRNAAFIPVWQPPSFLTHVNNLLMLFAVGIFGVGNSKSRLRRHMRHPMLTGFGLWAVAHLLVNGDVASLILFGGLLVWAIAEVPLINRQVHDYVPYQGGSMAGDIRLVVIALVLYAIITAIHAWLGVWPFPG